MEEKETRKNSKASKANKEKVINKNVNKEKEIKQKKKINEKVSNKPKKKQDIRKEKDELKELVIFYSSKEKKNITLKEYVNKMDKEDDAIYYACGETTSKIDMMPQVESLKDKNKEVLYLTDYVDEFVLKMLDKYEDKKFVNVASNDFDLSSEEEKEELKKKNEEDKEMFAFMKESLNDEVSQIRYTNKLKKHPLCLTSDGEFI